MAIELLLPLSSFILCTGISSLDQLHRDLMYKPPVVDVSRNNDNLGGGTQFQLSSSSASSLSCLAAPPALSLPSPLPFFFESQIFDIKLQPSFLQKQVTELVSSRTRGQKGKVLFSFLLLFVSLSFRLRRERGVAEQTEKGKTRGIGRKKKEGGQPCLLRCSYGKILQSSCLHEKGSNRDE